MIEVKNAKKSYKRKEVLNIHELSIPTGQCFGLVGNNGAGKTTLFRSVLDLITLDQGEILIDQERVNESESWKEKTGAFIDESFLIQFLTPEEYFIFNGKLNGLSKDETLSFVKQYDGFFNDEILNQKKFCRDFSKGNQKKIGIVAALIGLPKLLILDEPFANLDPSSQIKLKQIITDYHQKQNATVLISSHDLEHVTEVCERIVILNKGEVVKDVNDRAQLKSEVSAYFQSMA